MKTERTCFLAFKFICVSLIFSVPVTAMATGWDDNKIVVTGTRVPVPLSQIGGAFTLISEEDLRANQSALPVDIFRQVPGVAVSQSGGIGQLSQIRMRGAEGNHTLVLVDGVEANDPIFNGEFDFGFLTSTGIERIEVLRGAQSALYGSDSIGGVINIITRSGSDGFSGYGQVEGGSFGTVNTQAGLSGGGERYSASFNAGYFRTDGINVSRFGNEKDGSENVSFNFKGSAEPVKTLRLDAMLRYTDGKTEFDNQDFAFPPTPTNGLVIDSDSEEQSEQLFAHLGARLGLFDDVWVQRARVGFTDTKRQTLEEGDRIALREGERLKFTYQSTFNLRTPEWGADHILTAALEHEELEFLNEGATPDAPQNQKQKDDQTSFIGEYRLGIGERYFFSASVRHDDNDLFDDATTWRLGGRAVLGDFGTVLHGSYGTGITNPGFFELFGFIPDSFNGNPDLQPEESESFDIGIEQSFLDGNAVIDVTYFQADLQDEIVTLFDFNTFTTTVDNLDGKSKRRGVEVTFEARVSEAMSVAGSYTYTRSRQPDGTREVRRPKHQASASASYAFDAGRGQVNLFVTYTGEQLDSEFSANTPESVVALEDFVLVSLTGSYQLTPWLEAFGRVENLLDEDYEQIFSFRSPGIGAYAGLRLSWGPNGQ